MQKSGFFIGSSVDKGGWMSKDICFSYKVNIVF